MNDVNRRIRDRYWHLLCHRSEVSEPGDFLKLMWLGEEVVAYNDAGNVIVFDNVCPHRGTRFLTEEAGKAPLTCRYHGWSYRGGRLRIPKRESYAECEIENVRLGTIRSEWHGDFLFASILPEISLSEQLAGVGDVLADISRSIAKRMDLNSYLYHCDWKVAVENALEPCHIDLVHAETLSKLRLGEGRDELFDYVSVWHSSLKDTRSNARLSAMRRFFDVSHQYDGYVSIFMYPFSMISSTYGYSYSLQSFLPGDEPFVTYFSSRLLASRLQSGVPPSLVESYFESTAAFNRRVFEEDHQICQRVSRQFWNGNRRMPLSQAEVKVAQFRRLYEADSK